MMMLQNRFEHNGIWVVWNRTTAYKIGLYNLSTGKLRVNFEKLGYSPDGTKIYLGSEAI